jgi:hypothetical protein
MINETDIEAMLPDVPPKVRKVNADIAQYYMRQAFEEGYRAAHGGKVTKADWFPHWLKSQTRAVLVANGLITGLEGYK